MEDSFWVSDGTTCWNYKSRSFLQTNFGIMENIAVAGNKVYIFKEVMSNGYEFWVTDGTAEGTKLLKDIHPEFDDNNIEDIVDFKWITQFLQLQIKIGLVKSYGYSDGTEAGTKMLKDINQEGTNSSSSTKLILQFGDKVLFSADNGENGRELMGS